jgi:hypothetical protein
LTKSARPGIVAAMSLRERHPCDPTGVIHEAYAIEGITAAECRTIFFDWAVGRASRSSQGFDSIAAAKTLYADLGAEKPDHPMSKLLAEAAEATPPARRRGRRR